MDAPLTFPRRQRRRAALGAVAVAVGIATVVAPSTASAESPVSEHPEIIATSTSALEAHDRWTELGDTAAYLAFVEARDRVAELTAEALGRPTGEMVDAWADSDLDGQVAVLAAMTQLGVPWRRNARAEGEGFDCSGLTSYSWERSGVEIERSSRNQFRSATEVDHADARLGDLVWYPGHVMLYLGVGDAVVHSPTHGRSVEFLELSERRASWVRYADPTPESD
jgi:cell wall-associated NlpC family hydrolase